MSLAVAAAALFCSFCAEGFEYIISNHGITTEAGYPYTAKDGTCKKNQPGQQRSSPRMRASLFCVNACTHMMLYLCSVCRGPLVAATISKFVDVAPDSETALLQAVNVGPVSVAIEADQQCFQFYSGGILSDPSCGTQLDHGVLVVGYGTEGGKDFWIVKNSWGARWGESGYIRLIRGKNENQCGVTSLPSYPVV